MAEFQWFDWLSLLAGISGLTFSGIELNSILGAEVKEYEGEIVEVVSTRRDEGSNYYKVSVKVLVNGQPEIFIPTDEFSKVRKENEVPGYRLKLYLYKRKDKVIPRLLSPKNVRIKLIFGFTISLVVISVPFFRDHASL